MTPARTFRLVLAVAIVTSALGLFAGPLRAPDEIRTAEIAREMAVTGDYLVPRLCGDLFVEHPPLQYALMGASFDLFGVTDVAARVPSAIFGFLLILVIYALGRKAGGERAGLFGVLAWLSLHGFYQYGTRGMVDVPLTLFTALAWLGFVLALTRVREAPAGEGRKGIFAAVLLIYAAAAMAQLSKGPVGLVFIAGPVLAGVLLTRSFFLWRTTAHLFGLLLLFAPLAIWVGLLRSRGGQDAFEMFVYQSFLYRIIPVKGYLGGHQHGPLYYFSHLPGMALPWLIALPAVLTGLLTGLLARRRPADAKQSVACFLAAVFPVGLLLLSIPGTKRPLYLLPLLPALAAATGVWIALRAKAPATSRLDQVTFVILGLPIAAALGILTGIAAALVAPIHLLSPRTASTRIRAGGLLRRGFSTARELIGTRAASRSPVTVWTMAIATVLGLVVVPHIGSHASDLTPLAREVETAGVLGPDLVSYDFRERDRAVISFRTGVIVPNFDFPGDLARFLDSRESGHLVARRGKGDLKLGAHERRFTRLKTWSIGRRTYDLYRFTK